MTCHNCRSECQRFGKHRNGLRRFRCKQCSKTFTETHPDHLDGMYLPLDRAEMVLKMLLEGSSIATTSRVTGVHHGTIFKLLVLAGEKCDVRDVEADERHSKLVLNIAMGKRNQQTTDVFIEGVRHATRHGHFQMTTDGFAPYKSAITTTLHDRCDFAMLIKVYKAASDGEARYSPAEVAAVEVVPIMGQPDPERICTSIIERSNLSLRMGTRRFTRLTNAFSKKWENHWAAVACWYTFYNFCRVHKSIRMTPAMAAGIADHIWSVRELLEAA